MADLNRHVPLAESFANRADDAGRMARSFLAAMRELDDARTVIQTLNSSCGNWERAWVTVTAERDEALRSHEFMVRQFEIMQREKEHGWREAETWETRAEAAEAEIAKVRRLVAQADEREEAHIPTRWVRAALSGEVET